MKVSVGTARATIHCPIEPETLLADIQGELPLDEARGVQTHMRTCEICQARADQLRAAYEQVASLADVPAVPPAEVRDIILRDAQGRLRTARLTHGFNLPGRGLLLTLVSVIGGLVLLIVLLAGPFLQTHVLNTQRSQNALAHVDGIGPGVFYAETVKLIPVQSGGATWDLGEIIAVNEQSGRVERSLPASNQAPYIPELGIGAGANIRPALSPDGHTVIEAAIPADGHTPTAFAALDTQSGQVRYVTRLSLPSGATPQADPIIRQMWISSDNQTAFVLTDLAVGNARAPRLLQFDLSSGKQRDAVTPPLDDTNPADMLSTAATAIAPDGSMLYNAGPARNALGQSGVTVSFTSVTDRRVEATLFIPGSAYLLGLAITPDNAQLCLFNGANGSVTFISTATRAVTGTVALGSIGQPPSPGKTLQGTNQASLAVTPDSKYLVVAVDAPDNTPRNFKLWTVNIGQQSYQAGTTLQQPIGTIALSSDGSVIVALRANGEADDLATVGTTNGKPWLQLAGNAQVMQLIGGYNPTVGGS